MGLALLVQAPSGLSIGDTTFFFREILDFGGLPHFLSNCRMEHLCRLCSFERVLVICLRSLNWENCCAARVVVSHLHFITHLLGLKGLYRFEPRFLYCEYIEPPTFAMLRECRTERRHSRSEKSMSLSLKRSPFKDARISHQVCVM